ncbi:MAG TPA: HAD-IB family hydrolase [Candidatus Acidoferrum sp.]|nr:HAD-IB family hydrolase [Candidatus Acidoferrum sp.]
MTTPERVGAFFDVDGTLLSPPSLEWRFIAFLLTRDELSTRDIVRWSVHFAKAIVTDPRGATVRNKSYLAGLRASLAEEFEQSLANGALPLYTAALKRMTWHWSQGHRVFLVSGTLDCLAGAMARQLPGPVEIAATELEVCQGHWTGQIVGAHRSGEQKGRAARNLASRFGLSLWESYAYGNSTRDLPMLDSVGRRVVVNPPAPLRQIASSEGWQICQWRRVIGSPLSCLNLTPREAR